MPWRFDDAIEVETDVGYVAVHRHGAPGRPPLLLTHGTGFCASTWGGVAEIVGDRFEMYAIDRRGHGSSTVPSDGYDFTDFAADTVRVIDALGLRNAYGVGHSAGATDLLLAAATRSDAFRGLFAIEPTAMDPAQPHIRADTAAEHTELLTLMAERRSRFRSRQEVIDRYTDRGVFTGWRPDLLMAYVDDAFHEIDDTTVALTCDPTVEAVMLRHIFAAMQGSYRAGEPNHPFEMLRRVRCPTRVVTTEHSQAIYKTMADVIGRLVPNCSRAHLANLGHAAAQVDPATVAAEVLTFWAEIAT